MAYYDFRSTRASRPVIRLHPDCIQWIVEGKKKTTYSRNRREGIYEIVTGPLLQPKRLGIFIEMTPHRKCSLKEIQSGNFDTEGPFNNPEEFAFWCAKSGLDRLPTRGWIHSVCRVKVK